MAVWLKEVEYSYEDAYFGSRKLKAQLGHVEFTEPFDLPEGVPPEVLGSVVTSVAQILNERHLQHLADLIDGTEYKREMERREVQKATFKHQLIMSQLIQKQVDMEQKIREEERKRSHPPDEKHTLDSKVWDNKLIKEIIGSSYYASNNLTPNRLPFMGKPFDVKVP